MPATASPSKSYVPAGLTSAIARAQQFLMARLDPRGFWECELVVDSTVASDYVLYYHWVGQPEKAQNERIQAHLLKRQLPDGGWPQFPGGPAEVNATIKGYHALRLTGVPAGDPVLLRARECALRLGGIPKMHTFGKLYLAMCGLFPWKFCPLIPAEMMLFPTWFPMHIYKMSSWTRNLVVPLCVINHFKPVRVLPACPSLDELYPSGSQDGDYSLPRSEKTFTWRNFFLACDKFGRLLNHLPFDLFRRRGLETARDWMLARIGPGSDGMGAIFPGQLNTLIALELMGLKEHPLFQKEVVDFDGLVRGTVDDIRVAPCYSPVWDTAIIAQCLVDSGLDPKDPRLVKVADWLLDREIKIKGDWAENVSFPVATGWVFEFNNDYYPDVDDTFQVILALRTLRASDETRRTEAIARALAWCRAFQCKEGGYAAFDRDLTEPWLEQIPFADHNAILDPPCSDITGRALETLAKTGIPRDNPSVARALAFVRRHQEADGSWFGRWGVNYIYGTSHVLRGLALSGEEMTQPYILRARDWLEKHQNADGGWGESCWTYHDDKTRGGGPVFFPPAGMPGAANAPSTLAGQVVSSPFPITHPDAPPQPVPPNAPPGFNPKSETDPATGRPVFPSTASQTAWALLGLLACGNPYRESVERGIQYLLSQQLPDGSWHYPWFTGTGFPRIFYLKYTSYQWAWPLLALTWYRNLVDGKGFPE